MKLFYIKIKNLMVDIKIIIIINNIIEILKCTESGLRKEILFC